MKHWLIGIALAQAALLAAAQEAKFVCGGVGQESQERMKAEAARHDLMLTFSRPDGAYVADVDVDITSGGKSVLQARCGGPLMAVDVGAQGRYEIRAAHEGKEQRKSVTIGAQRPARLSFVWPGS